MPRKANALNRTRKDSAREVTENATIAAHAVAAQPIFRAPKPMARDKAKKKLTKRGVLVNGNGMGGELGDYLYGLENPFDAMGVRCPINYNPAPSFIQTSARTTVTYTGYSVANNQSRTFNIYPGHMEMAQGTGFATSLNGSLDPQAFHHPAFRITNDGATNPHIIGPIAGSYTNVNAMTTRPCIGTVIGNAAGTYSYAFNNASILNPATMDYDAPLPYTYSGTNGHVRWQLVSLGLRLRNVTPELNRGGSVVTVVPNTDLSTPTGSITSLAIYPTFRDHGDGSDGVYVKWIPRGSDLAFWHDVCAQSVGVPLVADADSNNVGLMVVLNNTSGYSQAYDIEVVCNWQLAGNLINTIGAPTTHLPALKNVVEPLISHALSHPNPSTGTPIGKTSNLFSKMGAAIMSHDAAHPGPTLTEKLGHLVGSGVKTAVVHVAHAVGRSLFSQ